MDDWLLVLNVEDDSLSVVDPETGELTATVPADFDPREVAVLPDGSKTYVTCARGSVVDVVDNDGFQVHERIERDGFEFPHGLALAGDQLLAILPGGRPAPGGSAPSTGPRTGSSRASQPGGSCPTRSM